MPPERTKQLVYELDAWYRSHTMRQKDLASALQLQPQQLAEILALRNRPTAEQILTIQDFLENDKPMTSLKEKLFPTKQRTVNPNAPELPEPAVSLMEDSPRNLNDAKSIIAGLRQELARQGASAPALPSSAPIAATVQKVVVARSPSPVAANVPIVTRPVAPTAKAPMNPLALLSLDDCISGYKKACQAGNKVLSTAYEAEVAKRTTKPRPAAPKSLLPDNPRDLSGFFATQSVAQLKALLSQAVLPADQGVLYQELKARGQ